MKGEKRKYNFPNYEILVISAFRRLRQESSDFEVGLAYGVGIRGNPEFMCVVDIGTVSDLWKWQSLLGSDSAWTFLWSKSLFGLQMIEQFM